MPNTPIHRALVSVSDKTGIVEFCQQLVRQGIEIISTGGTANLLRNNNIEVTDVSDYTGFPEIMGGRVKTLHPKIHGALLGRINQDSELMTKHGITPIDLVVVNLYPFQQTISEPDVTIDDAIENIDIGGPTMIRAAAKNHQRVSVLCDINDYAHILQELSNNEGKISDETRFTLARKAFAHTAQYDTTIANYLGDVNTNEQQQVFPPTYTAQYIKKQDLRYGENPHQDAAFYQDKTSVNSGIANAKQLQGKPLSYNNIADADAALECVRNFSEPCCVIVKHANPCGVAIADDLTTAYQRAFKTDSTSAFGGIIAFNQTLDPQTAEAMIQQQFVEVIIAPAIDQAAIETLQQKPNVRVLTCGELTPLQAAFEYKRVTGGLLIQQRDNSVYQGELQVVTNTQPSKEQLKDLEFAWMIAKYVKSNAIVYAKDQATVGIGAGQMSRVDSTIIAARKANDAELAVKNAVMASDAFFPFRDAIDNAAKAGITAIIQPGGSMRDQEVIDAANEHGIAMVFTSMRHFKH